MLAAAFGVLAADELLAFHAWLGNRIPLTDEGQLVLLPIVPVAATGWLVVLRRLRGGPAALWVADAALWAAAVAVDTIDDRLPYAASVVLEDSLELAGTACFVLALLGAARAVPRRAPIPAPAEPRAAVPSG